MTLVMTVVKVYIANSRKLSWTSSLMVIAERRTMIYVIIFRKWIYRNVCGDIVNDNSRYMQLMVEWNSNDGCCASSVPLSGHIKAI